MSDSDQLHFVTMLGSLRKASYNGAIARTLPSLAPEGVTITALNGLSEFPPYNADLQQRACPKPSSLWLMRLGPLTA